MKWNYRKNIEGSWTVHFGSLPVRKFKIEDHAKLDTKTSNDYFGDPFSTTIADERHDVWCEVLNIMMERGIDL